MCIFKEIGKFVKKRRPLFSMKLRKEVTAVNQKPFALLKKSYFQKMMVRSLMTSVILPRTGRM